MPTSESDDTMNKPNKTVFKVLWDNGHDCGEFPWTFNYRDEAEACGEDWVADMVDADPDSLDDEAGYSFEVIEVAAFPISKFGARWVCDGPDGRFHARTKKEVERLLTEVLADEKKPDDPHGPLAHTVEGTFDHFDRYIG
jgi:hypothetical protein